MEKTQNEIIFQIEHIIEICRKNLETLRKTIQDKGSRTCWVHLENALFQFTVLFYTHRSIWAHSEFWHNYANAEDFQKFTCAAYTQMITCTLANCYLILYFYIEGALNYHLIKAGQSINHYTKFMSMYRMPNEFIHTDEFENGLKILFLHSFILYSKFNYSNS